MLVVHGKTIHQKKVMSGVTTGVNTVLERSDTGSNVHVDPGGDHTLKSDAEGSPVRISNRLIFISILAFIGIGLMLAIVFVSAPTFLSPQTVIFCCVLTASSSTTLAFVLLKRANGKNTAYSAKHFEAQNKELLEQQLSSLQRDQKSLRRALQEEKIRAEKANQSKAAFLAHLSHDIRTPLNHIIGFSDLIAHQTFGPLGDKRYLTYINNIKQSGEGLLDSVADILELAELESGQKILSIQNIVIDEFLDKLRLRFTPRAKRCGITLQFECAGGVNLNSDQMGLFRILENLLDNAMRFTPTGGKVRVAAWIADDGVVFEVTDTGIGIPAERLSKLFSPFSQHDAKLKKEHGGMRLGLAIARAITELNGGEIAIDSTPTIGTTVAVSLPMNMDNKALKIKAA